MKTFFTCTFLGTLTICTLIITYDVHGVLTAKTIKVEADVKNLGELQLDKRLDWLEQELTTTNSNLNKVLDNGNKLIKDSQQSFDDNYWDLKATIANNVVSSKEISDLIPKLKDFVENADRQLTDLSGQSSDTLSSIDNSASDLSKAGTELIETSTKQVGEIGGEVKKAVTELAPIEKNVEETTGSLKEIAKTGDIATRELRKAQGKFKAVAKFILGFFHHNI